MKNLKRVLSLVLATVMVIGMMVVGASAADYKDADKISYKEAVDVMSAVGMIEGWDGSFGPDLTIDRAGAAKLITYLMIGKDLADKLTVTEDPFNDVDKNAWYAGYVAYCKSEKLIEGWGGNFDPNGTITAYGFAKLLLGALGYDASIEKLTGDSWEVNTAKLAIKTKLFAGNTTASGNDPMTRQEACLYAFNALQANMVAYEDKGGNITIGDITINNGASKAEPADETDIGCDDVNGDEVIQLWESLYPELTVEPGTDAFGRTTNDWGYNDYKGSFVVASASKTIVVNKSGKDLTYWLQTANKKYEAPAAAAQFLNGTDGEIDGNLNIGDVIEVYATGNTVDKVVVMRATLAEVTKVTKTTKTDVNYTYTVTLKPASGVSVTMNDDKLEGFDADTMEKGTYVLMTKGNGAAILADADVVTGKMTAKGTDYVKVDGTKYTYIGGVTPLDNYTNTYDFYLDANGYVAGYVEVEAAEEALNYFYISEVNFVAGDDRTFSDMVDTAKLAVTYLDGTTAIVDMVMGKLTAADVEDYKGEADVEAGDKYVTIDGVKLVLDEADAEANFYSYTTNKDGDVKAITAVTTVVDTDITVKKNNAKVEGIDNAYANNSTKLVLIGKDGADTVTGIKNFPAEAKDYTVGDGDGQVTAIMYTVDGKTITAIYVLGGTVVADNADTVYGWYVSTGDTYDKDGETVTDVVYNVNGKDETYTIKGATLATAKKTVVSIDVDGDGIATIEAINDKDSATMVEDTYAVLKTNGPTYYADDMVIYDVTGDEVVELDEIPENAALTYVLDDEKLAYVFVTCAAQDDGITDLGDVDMDYLMTVLPDAYAQIEEDEALAVAKSQKWQLIQYTFAKDFDDTVTFAVYSGSDKVSECKFNKAVDAGVYGLWLALETGDKGIHGDYGYATDWTSGEASISELTVTGDRGTFPAGTYTYTFTDGESAVFASGSFTVAK